MTKRDLTEQEKADALQEFDNDIWINLLNTPNYEEIGKLVYDKLLSTKPGSKYLSRKILIGGS